jgi:hypothetical protein
MRYDVSELTIPLKLAGSSGNVLLIYLIMYMPSGSDGAVFACSLRYCICSGRIRFAMDYVVMFGMVHPYRVVYVSPRLMFASCSYIRPHLAAVRIVFPYCWCLRLREVTSRSGIIHLTYFDGSS